MNQLRAIKNKAEEAAASAAVVPVRVDWDATVSIPPLPHHTAFFPDDPPRFRSDEEELPLPGDVDVPACPLPLAERLTPTQFYDRFVVATPETCLAERGAPQGSQAWLAARMRPLTGSRFGAVLGMCPYPKSKPLDVIEDKLWNLFRGSEPTAWGTMHEPHAQEAFEAWFPQHLRARYADAGRSTEDADAAVASIVYSHDNLMRFATVPYLAVSPDGFCEFTDADGTRKLALLEWKCAYYSCGKDGSTHPYASSRDARFAPNVPPHYGAQIFGAAGYLNAAHDAGCLGALPLRITEIFFGVWMPMRFFVTRMAANDALYKTFLFPKLSKFFFDYLLPAMTHKHNGLLKYCAATRSGTIAPETPPLF
jgi:hypothetical protein